MELQEIKSAVETYFDTDLTNKSRKQKYYFPRVVFYRIAYDNVSCSMSRIGEELKPENKDKGFNHATVLNALNQFQGIIDKYGYVEKAYYDLLGILVTPYFEKKKYENEKTRLLRQSYERKIRAIQLKHTIELHKLKQLNDYFTDLLELPDYLLKDFHETRILPYLRMNGMRNEKIKGIEVKLEKVG